VVNIRISYTFKKGGTMFEDLKSKLDSLRARLDRIRGSL
jgi:hypothetical protein